MTTTSTVQDHLVDRVQRELSSLVDKTEGLSEYDARRPLVGSGTSLLGLLQHTSAVVLGYVTECFGREAGIELRFFGPDTEEGADMWVSPDVERSWVVGLAHHTIEQVGRSSEALTLDSPGRVPWWGERGAVTFGEILAHVLVEVSRHAGQADILREELDGALGSRRDDPNVPAWSAQQWAAYRQRLEEIAARFR